MVKHSSKSDGQNGKVKVRVIEFELEGSDLSLQEGLKSITAALSRPHLVVASRPVSRLESNRPTADENGDVADIREQAEYVEDANLAEASVQAIPGKQEELKSSRPQVLYRYALMM